MILKFACEHPMELAGEAAVGVNNLKFCTVVISTVPVTGKADVCALSSPLINCSPSY